MYPIDGFLGGHYICLALVHLAIDSDQGHPRDTVILSLLLSSAFNSVSNLRGPVLSLFVTLS